MSRQPSHLTVIALAVILLVALVTTGAAAVVPDARLQALPGPLAPLIAPPPAPPEAAPAVPAPAPVIVPPPAPLLVPPEPRPRPAITERLRLPTPRQRKRAQLGRLEERIVWRRSTSLGSPQDGKLVNGVTLPQEGLNFVTAEAGKAGKFNPDSNRVGTDKLVRTILKVVKDYRRANPRAPRVIVGDLSLPRGGDFGPSHKSHQNGLDVDVYFPRRDREESAPMSVGEIDAKLAQDLVDRFVAAGAQYVFVGHNTRLRGPRDVVLTEDNHDDHAHVRFR